MPRDRREQVQNAGEHDAQSREIPCPERARTPGEHSTITASAIGNPYMFTGRQLDEETGLYYYRARHYSAELRRFVQRDPLEYVDGPNAYTYVRSRPGVSLDPTGTDDRDLHAQSGMQNAGNAANGYAGEGSGDNAEAAVGDTEANEDPNDKGGETTLSGVWPFRSLRVKTPAPAVPPKVNGKPMNCPCTTDFSRTLEVSLHEAEHASNMAADEVATSQATIDILQRMLIFIGSEPECPCGCGRGWVFASMDIKRAIRSQVEYARDNMQESLDAHFGHKAGGRCGRGALDLRMLVP